MRNPWHHRLAALALVTTIAVVGCGGDKPAPMAPTPTARVMAVHASPDAPAVDLLVDGSVVASGLAYPNHTAYLSVGAGVRNVKVNVAGTTTTVIETTAPVAGGLSYSVFACDSAAIIGFLVLVDDLTAPVAGKAHVRFIHLSPDAPAVDVAVQGGPVLLPNIAFKGSASIAGLDAGSYNLEVRLAGTGTVLLPLPGITLQAEKIHTVFLRGFAGGSGPQALGAQIIVNN